MSEYFDSITNLANTDPETYNFYLLRKPTAYEITMSLPATSEIAQRTAAAIFSTFDIQLANKISPSLLPEMLSLISASHSAWYNYICTN